MNQLGDVKLVLELIQRPSFVPQYMKTTLQMNRETSLQKSVSGPEYRHRIGPGVCFLDVDLDGFEDVLISNTSATVAISTSPIN